MSKSSEADRPAGRSPWTIRAYRPGDERELVALFQRVFGRAIAEDHWRWKLKQVPSPVENVWLAVLDEQPIFQYAAIPTRFRLNGAESAVMVSVDTMTAPEFQRRGLLSQVGRFTYDTWRAAGIPFVLGLPNQRWGSRTSALGWEPLFPLQWRVRWLRPEALLARRLRWPSLSRLRLVSTMWNVIWDRRLPARDNAPDVRPVSTAGPEFDALWQACAPEIRASVVRDAAWVGWRYLSAPALAYQVLLAERAGAPAGYVAYRLETAGERRIGYIAEVFTRRGDDLARLVLIRQAVNRLRLDGADLAVSLAVPGTPPDHAFRRAGFISSWGSFSVEVVPLASDLPLEGLRDPHAWELAGGDFDVI
jgi:hypothetical protein